MLWLGTDESEGETYTEGSDEAKGSQWGLSGDSLCTL